MVSVNNDNLNELTFTDNSNWNLSKEMYYLFTVNNSETMPIDSSLASSIIDNKSRPDLQSECYQIRYKDECGSLSQPSPQVCNINLTTQMDDELNWSHKSPFGLGNLTAYEILEIDENTNIEKVLKSLDPSIKKSKTDLKDFEVEAKYRIKGISSGDKESFSNIIKIPIEPLFFVPDVFTPNGDPDNGTFQIKGRYGGVLNYKLQIYDRWGTELLKIDDFTKNWDGTLQEQALPAGTYLYKLSIRTRGNENYIKQGKFELLR
jgi:gliding motility-associated-like protein